MQSILFNAAPVFAAGVSWNLENVRNAWSKPKSVWTLFGPHFGPRTVHLDPVWTTRGPFGPRVVHFGPIVVQMDRPWYKFTVVVQTGVQTDFVRTTFWTTSCVAVPENHRLSLVLVNPRTQKVTHMQRSHTYALKVFQTIVALWLLVFASYPRATEEYAKSDLYWPSNIRLTSRGITQWRLTRRGNRCTYKSAFATEMPK